MPGIEVLTKIREMDKNSCVIVATADIQTSTRSMTEAEGATAFVTKPFSAETVLAAVNTALERKQHGLD
jgi:DNA-binding response OmpR family regulator